MGSSTGKESCGRCSFSTVVETVEASKEDSADPTHRHDVYAGGHIEVDERELRLAAAPSIYAARVKQWLDRKAYRFIYGDRF